MACVACGQPLPVQATGRPRKTHKGKCTKVARQQRTGVRNPVLDSCRLCDESVEAGRRYYCSADHAARYDALNRAEREWLRRVGAAMNDDVPAASAAEILPGMGRTAIAWRCDRAERVGFPLSPRLTMSS